MAIIKYKETPTAMTAIELSTYTGRFGETTILEGTGRQFMHDGITPGGFEVSDDNTLTIEEIVELLNNYYVRQDGIQIRKIPATEPFSWSARSAHITSGLRAPLFKKDKFSQIPNNAKIPDDYVSGTPIDFYLDLMPEELDDDDPYDTNARFGVHWVVLNDGDKIDDMPHVYKSFLFNVQSTDVDKVKTFKLSDTNVIQIDPNLKAGSTIMYRIFRSGTNDLDTYKEDVYCFSAGIEYIGRK